MLRKVKEAASVLKDGRTVAERERDEALRVLKATLPYLESHCDGVDLRRLKDGAFLRSEEGDKLLVLIDQVRFLTEKG
jgi:hypothetical protein